MLAVIKAVTNFQDKLKNQSLLICMDNTTTMATINKHGGTKSCELTEMAEELWFLLDKLRCKTCA